MPLAARVETRDLLLAVVCAAYALLASGQVAGEPPEMRVASDVGGLEATSAALVLSGQQGGDLAASLAVFPWPGSTPETVRLALVVDLAAAPLTASATDETSDPVTSDPVTSDPLILEVHAYALGPGDALTAYFTQAFTVARSELAPEAARAGVKFLGTLDVPPGEWSVRLLVRERQSGRLALRARRVQAPDFATVDETLLLSPLFTDPVQRWILVRQAGDPDSLPFPLDLSAWGSGSGWLVPSTRAVVEPGGRAFYLVRRGSEPPTVEWTAQLSERGAEPTDRRQAESVPLRRRHLGALAPQGDPGSALAAALALWEVELDPGPLPSGSGVLTIAEADRAETSFPTVVLPPGAKLAGVSDRVRGGLVLWTDLAGAAVVRSQPLAPPSAGTAAETVRLTDEELARFQAAYLGAVRHLADGRWTAALAAVEELEQSRMSGGTAADLLARGQLQVAWDVCGGVVERVLPLIQLHGDLYREYRLAGHSSLAAHARRITLGLIELYVEHGGDEDRGRVAAAALVGVAGQLLAYGNSLETFGILELALEHDSEHPAALLLLASLHELLGNYKDAVSLLRRLEAATSGDDPIGAEGRLRLGINLQRVGSSKLAVERLQQSLAPDRPSWVRAVAYEELAALYVDEERADEARALLEQAIERMPGQQRLYIQLAAVYETLGRTSKVRDVLGKLEAQARRDAGRDRDSPRLRYSQWSEEALDSSRELFERAAAARMTALSEALADFMAQGG